MVNAYLHIKRHVLMSLKSQEVDTNVLSYLRGKQMRHESANFLSKYTQQSLINLCKKFVQLIFAMYLFFFYFSPFASNNRKIFCMPHSSSFFRVYNGVQLE